MFFGRVTLRDKDEATVYIYTDGGCDPNPGPGAWAAILLCKGRTKEISGVDRSTTNNRMEMTAAIRSLESLKYACKVVLNTDSQYLQRGITEWLPAWKRRQWRRKDGEIKNIDLWHRLDTLSQVHTIKWQWVRGHAGDPLNERCDALVAEAMARQRGG